MRCHMVPCDWSTWWPWVGDYLTNLSLPHGNARLALNILLDAMIDVYDYPTWRCTKNPCGTYGSCTYKNVTVSQKLQCAITYSYDVILRCCSRHWIKNDELFDLRLVLLCFENFENLTFWGPPGLGNFLYLTTWRPNIMQVVAIFGRFWEPSRKIQVLAAKRILKYLRTTTDYALWYPRGNFF